MKKTFGATLRFLGILAGGMSLFILAQTAFEFGMSEAFGTVVGYYQALVYPIVGLLEQPLAWFIGLVGWSLPEGWRDWFVLYVVTIGAESRHWQRLTPSQSVWDWLTHTAVVSLWPIARPLIFILAFILEKVTGNDRQNRTGLFWNHFAVPMLSLLVELVFVLLALILFLLLNSGLQSVLS